MDEGTFLKVMDDLAAVNFIGTVHYNHYNEPLLDPRLPAWIECSRNKLPSAILKVNSNGDFLDTRLAKQLWDAGLTCINVTIHDLKGEEAFARLSEVQKQFPKMIQIKSIHHETLFNRGGAIRVKKQRTGTRCTAPVKMVVDYRGNVLLCCNDYFHQHNFGNVHKTDLIKIWFGEDFLTLRKKLNRGIVEMDICKKCLGIEPQKPVP